MKTLSDKEHDEAIEAMNEANRMLKILADENKELKLRLSQLHPSTKEGFEKVLEELINDEFRNDYGEGYMDGLKKALYEYIEHMPVSSPKEISEEEIEKLFDEHVSAEGWSDYGTPMADLKGKKEFIKALFLSLPSSGSKIDSFLNEGAKGCSIKFSEWAHDKNWRFNVWHDRKWHNTANTHFSTTETKDLFELFLKDKQQ